MSPDNVTPIRAGGDQPPPANAKKTPRPRRAKPGLVLAETGEFDGFSTREVLNGLHGVCEALDLLSDNADIDCAELSTAAKVLASLLQSLG